MRILLPLLLLTFVASTHSQSSYVPKRTITYDLVDRYKVLYAVETPIVSSTSNFFRSDICAFAQEQYARKSLNTTTRSNLAYLIEDNLEYLDSPRGGKLIKTYTDSSETFYALDERPNDSVYVAAKRDPIFSHFYKNKATFLEFKEEAILIKANPIFNIDGGLSKDPITNIFQNTRGLEIRGVLDQKIYFYTSLLENQRAFLNFQNQRILKEGTIPGYGLFKAYQSKLAEQLTGYDYFNAQAYFGLPVSDHVNIEFGHGNHFWGDGFRSLLLSDNAHNFLYFKINSRVWKFQLQNVFAEVAAIANSRLGGDRLVPKKYFASHYLTFSPIKTLSISLFETVIFSRENNFELQYLNPIILYRTVEHFIGSPDNVMLGANGRWDLFKRISVYGQVLLDELKFGELTGGRGWWGNKFGLQLGLKYFNALNIDHLDLQVEYNVVRPFTYTHRTPLEDFPNRSISSYSHYSQSLAHPLGANFKELLLRLKYQFGPKWHVDGRAYMAIHGRDTQSEVVGGDIYTLNELRDGDFGYNIGDGVQEKVFGMQVRASYMFAHNYWVDFTGLYRTQDIDSGANLDTRVFNFGVRANVANLSFDY